MSRLVNRIESLSQREFFSDAALNYLLFMVKHMILRVNMSQICVCGQEASSGHTVRLAIASGCMNHRLKYFNVMCHLVLYLFVTNSFYSKYVP